MPNKKRKKTPTKTKVTSEEVKKLNEWANRVIRSSGSTTETLSINGRDVKLVTFPTKKAGNNGK